MSFSAMIGGSHLLILGFLLNSQFLGLYCFKDLYVCSGSLALIRRKI